METLRSCASVACAGRAVWVSRFMYLKAHVKTYVGVLTGDAPRQSNARLLALVLAILVGVIGTLVILAVWLSPTPEQIQAARNGQGEQGTQQSTPAGDAQPSLLGQYGEYEQSASTPRSSNPRLRERPSNPRPRQRPSSQGAGLLR